MCSSVTVVSAPSGSASSSRTRTFRVILCAMPRVLFSIVLLMTGAAAADELPGAALYRQKMCVSCHAADGSGNTPAGKATKARDLRSPEVQKATDAELADVIAAGRGKMPAYKSSLSADQIGDIVAFLRTMKQ